MFARYYRLLPGALASLSLALAAALAGCGADRAGNRADPVTGALPASTEAQKLAQSADPEGTDQTIWTVLGLAKRDAERNVGPQTGDSVSPVLWQATRDALGFAGLSSEDPASGLLVTDWYSPRGKPNERLRVNVFILSRALRSDSVAVTVERQERTPGGQWRDAPVARDVVSGLENTILQRARQIHAERYRSMM
jgi:hypothetical protein